MKKILPIVTAACLLFLLTACASQPAETVGGGQTEEMPAFTEQDSASEEAKEPDALPEGESSEAAAQEGESVPTGTAEIGQFDLETGSVLLNSGYEMPILGIGTYALSTSQAENSVYWALRDGYRLIDTARIYGNEEGVGRGIQRAIDDGWLCDAGRDFRHHKDVDQ